MIKISEDLANIQGIILRGYQRLESALFVHLKIDDAKLAKAWLKGLIDQVCYGGEDPTEASFNIAFTFEGMKVLGLKDDLAIQFSAAFQSGMSTEHRQNILGDTSTNESSPANWDWGKKSDLPIHLTLMIYASETRLASLYEEKFAPGFLQGGLTEVIRLKSSKLAQGTEHFGFKDGISNPHIAGLSDDVDAIQPGEFLLGYKNEYGLYAERPLLDAPDLPKDEEGSGKFDFGRNGSYMVFRQLHQDVHLFWKTLNDKCTGDSDKREMLAAKMVGRWRSGAPLVLTPNFDDPTLSKENQFGYFHQDPDGLKCPLGAHIRRTNPRDGLDPDPGSEKSLAVNRKHRIIRRGRSYGEPLTDPIDPQEIINKGDDGKQRGLLFICFNANLTRQFEFIQNSWMNNPKFGGLYDNPDPLLGDRGRGSSSFTVQGDPVRTRYDGLPQFVHTKGGAYFFMPGKQAMNYLANLSD